MEKLRWARATISQAGFHVGEEKLVDLDNEIIEGFVQTGVLVLIDDALPLDLNGPEPPHAEPPDVPEDPEPVVAEEPEYQEVPEPHAVEEPEGEVVSDG